MNLPLTTRCHLAISHLILIPIHFTISTVEITTALCHTLPAHDAIGIRTEECFKVVDELWGDALWYGLGSAYVLDLGGTVSWFSVAVDAGA